MTKPSELIADRQSHYYAGAVIAYESAGLRYAARADATSRLRPLRRRGLRVRAAELRHLAEQLEPYTNADLLEKLRRERR